MQFLHSCAQHLFREVIRGFCWLAVLYVRVRCACKSLGKINQTVQTSDQKKKRAADLEHGLECLTKRSLSQAGTRELRSPQQIRVAKDEFNRCSVAYGTRAIDDPPRQYDIYHDLDIERPVARVMENEDRGYWRLREINSLQSGLVFM